MGELINLPRDTEKPIVSMWAYDTQFFMAQFEGYLCPHYHYLLREAERCQRRLVKWMTGPSRHKPRKPCRLRVMGSR